MRRWYGHVKFAECLLPKLLLSISPIPFRLILDKRREELLHQGNSSLGKSLFQLSNSTANSGGCFIVQRLPPLSSRIVQVFIRSLVVVRRVEPQPDNRRPRRVWLDVYVEGAGWSSRDAGVDVLDHANAANEHKEPPVLLQPGDGNKEKAPEHGEDSQQPRRLGQ